MANDWEIKSRAEKCAVTERPFQDGEYFYTLLFHDKDGFRREDLSEEAWQQRNDNIQPFSFWRAKFEPPPPQAPEALRKEPPRICSAVTWRRKTPGTRMRATS